MTPKDELGSVLSDKFGRTMIAETIDALIKERITQAFYEYEARKLSNRTGHYPPSPDELNIEHIRAGLARSVGRRDLAYRIN